MLRALAPCPGPPRRVAARPQRAASRHADPPDVDTSSGLAGRPRRVAPLKDDPAGIGFGGAGMPVEAARWAAQPRRGTLVEGPARDRADAAAAVGAAVAARGGLDRGDLPAHAADERAGGFGFLRLPGHSTRTCDDVGSGPLSRTLLGDVPTAHAAVCAHHCTVCTRARCRRSPAAAGVRVTAVAGLVPERRAGPAATAQAPRRSGPAAPGAERHGSAVYGPRRRPRLRACARVRGCDAAPVAAGRWSAGPPRRLLHSAATGVARFLAGPAQSDEANDL